MAKALKTIGKVAGIVALVAAPFNPGLAAIAGAVSAAANVGASVLAKPPPARGSVTEVIVEVDPPSPYAMGDGYFAGVKRMHKGYGPTLKKVPNPYLAEVYVYSVAGPIEGPLTPQFDFANVSSWYSGFFDFDSQLGASPEASALVAPYGTPPGWTSAHKLSGQPAILFNYLFDKDGKRYASGLPQRGAKAKWVLAYDPRKDSTFAGGSGAHRITDESTWEWTANPALHAGTYAYGRYQNGKRVMGMGLPFDAIGDSFAQIAAWANDCDANGWTMFGVVYEGGASAGPGQRWSNLRDICIAGGGEPMPLNTGVGFHWDRPRVVLDTITEEDISGEIDLTAMRTWRERLNTIIPKGTSLTHNYELMPFEAVQNATYLTEDGEERRETFPFNFVDDSDGGDQLGQLAAYRLANSRELLLDLPCMPRLRRYRPGDCLRVYIRQNGEVVLDTPAVIVNRTPNPSTYEVTLSFQGETVAKHAWALGQSAVPPPSPGIGMSAQDRDETAAGARSTAARRVVAKTEQFPLSADIGEISIATFDATLDDGRDLSLTGTTLTTLQDGVTALSDDTTYAVFWDLVDEEFFAVAEPASAGLADSTNAFIGWQTTPDSGGTYSPPPDAPPGYGGGGDPNYNIP